ncbi:MAG: FAD/NAD(P)-binding protein [bacterium]|nr:FAD/NAD(P)-binding protein [bacterium]
MNPYLPHLATIQEIIPETASQDVKTFRVVFTDPEIRRSFTYQPGQFAEVSLFGAGEAPISITSSPTQEGYLEFSVKRAGVVTTALHYRQVGDPVGIRGPYGNNFPYRDMEGQNIVFIGGGIGLAPLRSLITFVLDPANRSRYAGISIIYGARSPGDLVFKWELERWGERDDVDLQVTVDRGDDEWTGRVGFVPQILLDLAPRPDNTVTVTCGPPIMIKFVLQNLEKLGFTPAQIVTTLEMRMKCGIGKCGRCNIGSSYVCQDGPVYTYEQLRKMPAEY